MTRNEFKELVMSAGIDDVIVINKADYRKANIDFDRSSGEFSWSAEHKYLGWVFPGPGQIVQTFKTINGARKSLIKKFERLFEEDIK